MLVDAQTKTFSNPETFRIAFFVRDYLAGFEKKSFVTIEKKKKKLRVLKRAVLFDKDEADLFY